MLQGTLAVRKDTRHYLLDRESSIPPGFFAPFFPPHSPRVPDVKLQQDVSEAEERGEILIKLMEFSGL